MTNRGYDPQEEWDLVFAAARSKQDLKRLREALEPVTEKIVSRYLENQPQTSRQELIEAAFKPLPLAVQHFVEHKQAGKAAYKFSTYYTWWAKQAIEDELRNKYQ